MTTATVKKRGIFHRAMSSVWPRYGASQTTGDPQMFLMSSRITGALSTAGVAVTERTAMNVPAVFACVRAIAEDIAKLPLILYRRLEDGGKERADDHAIAGLLRYDPNPEMTAFTCRQTMALTAALWGNGYAQITRKAGVPDEVWPLPPWCVQHDRDGNDKLIFRVTDHNGKQVAIKSDDMIHVPGISDTGLIGWSMADVGAQAIGLALAAAEFTGAFFRFGASPSGIVELAGKLEKQALEKYAEQFAEKYAGSSRAHRPIVLDQGAKFTATMIDSEKSQRIETMLFSVVEVARYFRVPLHKIQSLEAATFSNIEHQGLEYVGDVILPWCTRFEQEYRRKLLMKEERVTLFFEHLMDVLLRADAMTRAQVHNMGIHGGWKTPNEAREQENLNPYRGGERFRMEQNLALLDENGDPVPANDGGKIEDSDDDETPEPPSEGAVEGIKVAFMPVFVDAAERMLTREVKAIEGRKGVTEQWLASFYSDHREQVAAAFEPSVRSMAKTLGGAATDLAQRYAAEHVDYSRRNIASMPRWLVERPAAIARDLTERVAHEAR